MKAAAVKALADKAATAQAAADEAMAKAAAAQAAAVEAKAEHAAAQEKSLPSPAAPPDPARAVRPLSEVDSTWQLQLNISCETASIGCLEKPKDGQAAKEERKELYGGADGTQEQGAMKKYAYRDLVVSGGATAFDLAQSILVAYGLSTSAYNHTSNLGKLDVGQGTINELVDHVEGRGRLRGLEYAMLLQDVVVGETGAPRAAGKIAGLHASKPKHGDLSSAAPTVTAADLKKVKLCQLLDRPLFSSACRAKHTGVRSMVVLEMLVPERFAFCSRVTGGCLNKPVRQTLYTFVIGLEAIGSKAHMKSDFQARLPRCVGGSGGVYGGNCMEWEYGMPRDHRCWKLAELDCVNIKFNNGRQIRGLIFPAASGVPDDDVLRIAGHLCYPLFDIAGSKGQETATPITERTAY